MESKNFKAKELSCKHCGAEGVQSRALSMLQELRDLYGKPMVVNSAYRCSKHPEEAKKEKPGQHNAGTAFDIKCTPAEMVELIALAHKVGFKGFGMYKTFLHIDAREQSYVSGWRG